MADTNIVILIGRLTRDSELKYTTSGTAIATFSVATSEYQGTDKEMYTNYIDCTMFGKRAESLNQYLTKGTQLSVVGLLHQDRWEKDGTKRSKLSIKVSDVQLLGSKGGQTKQVESSGPETTSDVFEDDIPF